MTNLKCNVVNCAHNQGHRCCLQEISVCGPSAETRFETSCDSFSAQTHAPSNSRMESNPNTELDIHCTAKQCVHHTAGGGCDSDCVCVGSFHHNTTSQQETQCETFAKCGCHRSTRR